MEIEINIEKRHMLIVFSVLVMVMSSLFALAQQGLFVIPNSRNWHPLQNVVDSAGNSIDHNSNSRVDRVDWAERAKEINGTDLSKKLSIKVDSTNCKHTGFGNTGSGNCAKSCTDIGENYVLVESIYGQPIELMPGWPMLNGDKTDCVCCPVILEIT